MNKEIDFFIENNPLATLLIDETGNIISANGHWKSLSPKKALINQSINDIFNAGFNQSVLSLIEQTYEKNSDNILSTKLTKSIGSDAIHVELRFKKIEFKNQKLWIVIALDVNKYVNEIENLNTVATKDSLTGINNRWSFFNKLDEEIKKAKRYFHQVSLILIDIDHFKKVNDTYGHQEGDRLLINVANSVDNLLRDCDVFARLGGDEFVLLMPETNLNQANRVANRIKNAINNLSHRVNDKNIIVSASLGIASLSGHDVSRDKLIALSDSALYRAKFSGRNKVETKELDVA